MNSDGDLLQNEDIVADPRRSLLKDPVRMRELTPFPSLIATQTISKAIESYHDSPPERCCKM
jgi:hypothetical protein